jgi:uncharacterized protein involved in response to NO
VAPVPIACAFAAFPSQWGRAMKGHQPFFFLAGLVAVLEIGVWLASLATGTPMPGDLPAPQFHAHEMLFGYLPAVVAGFLLSSTAGWRVALLSAIWLAGRLAMAVPALPPPIVAAIDLAFLPALALFRLPALWKAPKWPTIGFVPLLGCLCLADLLWHLDAVGKLPGGAHAGEWLALDLFILMIVVIAGRLVPGYTRAMAIPIRKPKNPGREAASILMGLALLAFDQLGWEIGVGLCALALAGLQLWRLAGWRTVEVLSRPTLLVLHIGFAWLVFGLLLRGVAALSGRIAEIDAVHAITVGAIGTLTLGMMGRLTRAHARQPDNADLTDIVAYGLVFAGALARSILPGLLPADRPALIFAAGVLWMMAFALFLIRHGLTLLRRQSATS